MASTLVQHNVKDFAQCKNLYASVADLRASNSEFSDHVHRDASDPSNLGNILKWESLANPQKHANSQTKYKDKLI
ncbi:MAG: hypothetical protein P8X95_11050 [Anaerolineales bacterium]|jgi:hypothetical protein